MDVINRFPVHLIIISLNSNSLLNSKPIKRASNCRRYVRQNVAGCRRQNVAQ